MENFAAPPTPFGKAWLRPVELRAPAMTIGGALISGKAGRDKPAIVVFPGSFRAASTLYALARALSDGFDLLLVDYPGFGATSVAEPPTIAGLAARGAAMANAFLPGRALFALGESIGGVVALALAAEPPAETRAVVAIDPPLSTRALAEARAYLRASAEGLAMNEYFAAWCDGPGVMGDGAPDGFFPALERAASRAAVLVLAGGRATEAGRASPAALIDDADAARAAPYARVARIAGAGHLVAIEATEACAAAVKAFLDGV